MKLHTSIRGMVRMGVGYGRFQNSIAAFEKLFDKPHSINHSTCNSFGVSLFNKSFGIPTCSTDIELVANLASMKL